MQRYHNLSSDSGVTAYEIRPGAIVVEFRDGWRYEYTEASAGPPPSAPCSGWRGLSAFIATTVREGYARKFQ